MIVIANQPTWDFTPQKSTAILGAFNCWRAEMTRYQWQSMADSHQVFNLIQTHNDCGLLPLAHKQAFLVFSYTAPTQTILVLYLGTSETTAKKTFAGDTHVLSA